jgi:HlyD family secretion protein
VWALDRDGKPRAIPLTLGISDGSWTEVLRGEVQEGEEVIVGVIAGAAPGGRAPAPGGGSGPRLRL